MDPYAPPNKRRIGENRPKIAHLDCAIDQRTRRERQAEKQAVVDERRAIKKSARQNLKKQMRRDLNDM